MQIDKTADAMAEIQRELADFAGGTRPVTDAELGRARAILLFAIPLLLVALAVLLRATAGDAGTNPEDAPLVYLDSGATAPRPLPVIEAEVKS